MSLKQTTLILILFTALMNSPNAVIAQDVNEEFKIDYYPISGSKIPELRRQLPSGKWGSTRWNLKHSSDCQITVRITVTLPKLIDASQLQPNDHKKYQVMYKALEKHEMDHVAIIRKAVRELDQNNCQNANAIKASMRKSHKKYDTQTIHGWRQGVRLY